MNIEMLIFLAVVFTVFSVCYTVSYCSFVKKESTFRICDALDYALWLTFEECEKMDCKTDEGVSSYDITIFLQNDYWREDCLRRDEDAYPTIYHLSLRKSYDAKQKTITTL